MQICCEIMGPAISMFEFAWKFSMKFFFNISYVHDICRWKIYYHEEILIQIFMSKYRD
jgi:hypothetical protein